MRWLRSRLVLYGFLALAAGASARAETVTISGVVVDDGSGDFLRGVQVTAAGGQGKRPALTDDSGVFVLELAEGVKPGQTVRIRAELEGYVPFDRNVAASALTAPIRLKKKPAATPGPRHPATGKPGGADKSRAATSTPANLAPIDHFIRELRSQDLSARGNAAEALGNMGTDARAAGPALVRALQDPDLAVRVLAARALQKVKPQSREAVNGLVIALKDGRSADLRKEAARALGEIGPIARGALPALRVALTDEDPQVQIRAAEAYVEIDPAGAPELDTFLARAIGLRLKVAGDVDDRALVIADRLHQPPKTLVPVLLANLSWRWSGEDNPEKGMLEKIGARGLSELEAAIHAGESLPAAVWFANHLIATDPSLKSPLTESFRQLAAALEAGRIDGGGIVYGIRALLALDPTADAIAARALVAAAGRMQGIVSFRKYDQETMYAREAEEIGDLLRTIGAPAIPVLRGGLERNRENMDQAVWFAASLLSLDASAKPDVAAFLGDQIERTHQSSAKTPAFVVATELLKGLGREGASATPALLRAMGGPSRCKIFPALVAVAPEAPELIDLSLEAMKAQEYGWCLRDKAAEVLINARTYYPKTAPALVEALALVEWEKSVEIQKILVQMGSAAVPALVAGLQNNTSTREQIEVLGKIGPPAKDAVAFLGRLLRDERLGSAAIDALGGIGAAARESVPLLIRAFKRSDDWEKRKIAEAFGKIGLAAAEAIPILEKELRTTRDEEVRIAVRAALGKIRQPASLAGASDP